MTGQTAADAKVAVAEHERPERREHMPAPTLSDLEVAVIRVVQEDLPLVERPFVAQGEQLGCSRLAAPLSAPGLSSRPCWSSPPCWHMSAVGCAPVGQPGRASRG